MSDGRRDRVREGEGGGRETDRYRDRETQRYVRATVRGRGGGRQRNE